MANPATGCRCGSGGHPRQCDLHPEAYRLHVAELNLLGYVDETDREDARAAVDEFGAAFVAASRAPRERAETAEAELEQADKSLAKMLADISVLRERAEKAEKELEFALERVDTQLVRAESAKQRLADLVREVRKWNARVAFSDFDEHEARFNAILAKYEQPAEVDNG